MREEKEEKRRGDKERGDGPTPRCKTGLGSKGDEEEENMSPMMSPSLQHHTVRFQT